MVPGLPLLVPGSPLLQAVATPTAWPADDDPHYWEKLRHRFPLREDEVFFNTATLGAPSRDVLDAMSKSFQELAATMAEWDYKPSGPNWFTGYYAEDWVRGRLASLLHADVQEIALTDNSTMGMSFLANGLDLAAGDEVLQTDQEHPGSRCVWELQAKRRGIVWKSLTVPVPATDPLEIVELVRKAITPRTRVIAWPHITSGLGVVHPVKEIARLARERGVFMIIDGAQAVGQIEVDVENLGCDAYVGSPHKWLLAPAGNGFLYLKRASAPKIWTTIASSEWSNDKDPGLRLQQRGTGNLSLLVGLDAALRFHQRVGPARWRARIKELGDYLRASLAEVDGVVLSSSTHPAMCAGMTTWKLRGKTPAAMQDFFWAKGRLRPRAVHDEWGVRTSTAIYNSKEEIDRLLALTREMARS